MINKRLQTDIVLYDCHVLVVEYILFEYIRCSCILSYYDKIRTWVQIWDEQTLFSLLDNLFNVYSIIIIFTEPGTSVCI